MSKHCETSSPGRLSSQNPFQNMLVEHWHTSMYRFDSVLSANVDYSARTQPSAHQTCVGTANGLRVRGKPCYAMAQRLQQHTKCGALPSPHQTLLWFGRAQMEPCAKRSCPQGWRHPNNATQDGWWRRLGGEAYLRGIRGNVYLLTFQSQHLMGNAGGQHERELVYEEDSSPVLHDLS